jgi:hypothetical protein
MTVAVLNPLGAGLAHYTGSLEHILSSCGTSVQLMNITEPSSADYGKARWLASYFYRGHRVLKRGQYQAVIATWPTLGYVDLLLLSTMSHSIPVYVVMHDPRPLVYARGYGVPARRIARLGAGGRGRFLVHSEIARRAICEDSGIDEALYVPHPMFAPTVVQNKTFLEKTVRVLGQYKADRDILGLRQLAGEAPPSWRLEVVGRGWPDIEGWRVVSRFVDEDSFDQLIRDSDAVLIPYTRFFQSGVAVRALEAGVPVVGPSASSLSDLLGSDCEWLVRDGDWLSAVTRAVNAQPQDVLVTARGIYDEAVSLWSRMLATEGLV